MEHQHTTAHGRNGPLTGVRVIDMTRALAGPYCTMLLADLGADVVKVEPLEGDMSRAQGPFRPDDVERHYGGYFQSINRNKQSICLDLKSDEGKELLLELACGADVLIENFRAGVMERLGLPYELFDERNPRLVYGAIRGFGDARTGAGPHLDRPAFDVVAQAMGGVMHMTGDRDGPPMKIGPGIGDIFPAALTAVGVLAAVVEAKQTGKGRFVEVSMYDAILSLAERVIHQNSFLGIVPGREGNDHPILCPFGVFEAADGYIALAANIDRHWRALCARIGIPEAGTDPKYATNNARLAVKAEVRAMVENWTRLHTREQIVDLLATKVPVGPVNSVADVLADPHTHARKMVIELPQPGSATPVAVAGTPIKFTGEQHPPYTRAPLLGENSVEILTRLGKDADEIERLIADSVVGSYNAPLPHEVAQAEQPHVLTRVG